MKILNKDLIRYFLLPHGLIILVFGFLSLAFYYPLLEGKILIQSDIRQYEGMSRELNDYRTETREETYWINNAFGGMPTYQLGAKYPADFLSPIYSFIRILPRPAHILFLYFMGAYLLLLVIKMPYRIAFFGALAFGFSTYLLIILQVGHNTKALAVSFFSFVIAGLILLFQKKYFTGFILTTLALGMQIRANHYQMTYYLLLLLGIFIISYGISAWKEKKVSSIITALSLLILSGILSLGFNATPLLATAEYSKFSTRGSSELKLQPDGTPKEQSSGLEYEYITEYSYGIFESLNLFVPRIQGGGSSENLGKEHGVYDFLKARGVGQDQAIQFSENVPTYWGSQPILEAPAYVGITVLFFALFALFFVNGPLKNALAIGVLFSLLLSWGKNFNILTQLFIDYFPFYNKFRAVSSIQVVLELCMPILASMGLYWIFSKADSVNVKRLLKVGLLPTGILTLLLFFKSSFSFLGLNDGYFEEIYGVDLVNQIVSARKSIFNQDLVRGILYCLVLMCLVIFINANKVKKPIAFIIVLGILLFDLLGISSRYIDYDGFVSKRIAQNSFRQTTADKAILQDTTHYRVYEPQLGLNGARTAYFHNTIGGYHGAKPRRFEELINYYNTHQISGILDMLNIKYILFPNQETGALEPLKNPNFFGPAWTVQTLIEMPTADALLNRLKITDLKREALFIKGSLGIDVAKEYKLDSLATLDLNTITSNKINYRATSSVSQFIVFSEMYYPEGWTAKVNGKETPIYNLNYVLRGISVAPGVSEIEFEFTPLIIAKGTTIRWITVFLFLLSILTLGYFQFRKRKILQVWG